MSNLLKDASILLTPTGYDNGKMLSIKPEDGDGDFTFSRNSAATRVNAQGLVENVQILSSNLVQNGSFSQIGTEEVTNGNFSQEGSELVTNGDFSDGSTGWQNTFDGEWVISGGKATLQVGADGSYLSAVGNILTTGKSYKAVITTSGGLDANNKVTIYANSNTGEVIKADGTNTLYFTANGTIFRFSGVANDNPISIDNVSVKEVGQDWNLIGTATITENQANIVTASAVTGISQLNILTIGKSYKLSYNIVSNNNGGLKISGNEIPSVVGNNIYYFEASAASLEILRNSGITDISITNISVKEVGQNWTFGDGFTPDQANSKATCDGTQSAVTNLTQTISTNIQNKLVRVSFTLDYTAGVLLGSLSGTGAVDFNNITSSGTYTAEMTSNEVSPPLILQGDTNFIGSITNIVLKEVTNDTDLPRINYEGFSYDGNGDIIPNSGCGSWLLEDESTNLVPYSEDFSLLNAVANAVVTSNQIISPSGLLDADEITFDGTLYGRVEASFSVTNGATYTISVYLKNKDLSDVTQVWFGFDQIGLGQFITITDEWQRYEITLAANGTTEYPRIQFSGSGSLYAWGFQTEQQSYATSYIPTSGASSTRLQDLATDSGNSTLINSTEGVLYAEIKPNAIYNLQRWLSLSDGSHNNTVKIGIANSATDYKIACDVRSGGVNQAFMTKDFGAVAPEYVKVAVKYKENDFALWVNGTEVETDTSGSAPIGLSELAFDRGTPAQSFYGKTKALAVYKEALTDEELTCLTKEDLDGIFGLTFGETFN